MTLNPILQLAIVLAANAVMGTAAYTALRKRMLSVRDERTPVTDDIASRFDALEKQLEICQRQLVDAEQRYSPVSESFPGPASIHLNRRGQVAQLHRRGETPRKIASVLGISQGEVKLIIKLHALEEGNAHSLQDLALKPR